MTSRTQRRSIALARAAAERMAQGKPPKMVRGRMGIWQPGDDPLPLQDVHPALYRSEDVECRVIWTDVQLGTLGPHVKRLLFHIPNGGGRSPAQAALLKAHGVRPGVSDYFLPLPVGNTMGLWIEVKAVDGKPSDPQLEWLSAMRDVGYAVCVAYGAAAAIDAMRQYMQGRIR